VLLTMRMISTSLASRIASARVMAILILILLMPLTGTQTAMATEKTQNGPAGMAIGLAGVVDWTVQQPFTDVMKTARPWIGHFPGQWGGMTEADLIAAGILDQEGWPTSVPSNLRGIGTVLLTDLPEAAVSLAGRYLLRFDGDGIVEVGGRAARVRYSPGAVEFDFAPGPGPVTVTINRTDRQGTGNHVRNISIAKLDNIDRLDAGEIFNPDWIARVDRFGTIRFMDWMATNNSAISDWSDRPLSTDNTYARKGVPLEIMVRLANQIRANPWFNMPHRATDDYIRQFAEQVLGSLDPRLTAYVEYSNEVWNWQFGQAAWTEDQAATRWGQEYAWMQYYGMRSAQMADIWKSVYGPKAAAQLVTVISTQTAWSGLELDALEAPLWVAEAPLTNTPPASHVDAYAIAGYFGRALGTRERATTVRGWIAQSLTAAEDQAAGLTGTARATYLAAHKYDLAIGLAAQDLRDGSVSGDTADTLAELFSKIFPYHHEIAQKYGLDLIMYEGGTHIAGVAEIVDDDNLTEFYLALNYSPQMGALYADLLHGWRDAGGRLFNAYVDVLQPGKWGSWGALRHLDDDNPRWNALIGAD